MLASELNGLKVYAAAMKMIGNVVDEMIDPQGYALTDLEVKLEKSAARTIFGESFTFGSPKVRVPVSTIDKIGDDIILKFTVDQLKEHIQKI
jgi:sporulation protein YlmC with PRC-barrel domain